MQFFVAAILAAGLDSRASVGGNWSLIETGPLAGRSKNLR